LSGSEVMAPVISGLMNKQVGGALGISEITVKAHLGRMMQKMKPGSLADLVKIAAKPGSPPVAPSASPDTKVSAILPSDGCASDDLAISAESDIGRPTRSPEDRCATVNLISRSALNAAPRPTGALLLISRH
jgi:Bacterial regulatory proteins, luxR family